MPQKDIVKTDSGTCVFDLVHYKSLQGAGNLKIAEALHYMNSTGVYPTALKATLTGDASMTVRPGALYYMKGRLSMKSQMKGGIAESLRRKIFSNDSVLFNSIQGSGEVFLEPVFGHYIILTPGSESLVLQKAQYVCSDRGLAIRSVPRKHLSPVLFESENFFPLILSGEGQAVVYSPIPENEILKVRLYEEILRVDGDFVLMYTSGLSHKAGKSSRSWFESALSGEGIMQEYSGSGTVWLMPTAPIYAKLEASGELVTQKAEFSSDNES